jgi:hypothetical protein
LGLDFYFHAYKSIAIYLEQGTVFNRWYKKDTGASLTVGE